MTSVYLCAPMRDANHKNEPLFSYWALAFRRAGLTVFSPPEISMPSFFVGPVFLRSKCIAVELEIICMRTDVVLVLDKNWVVSSGCAAEVAAAHAVNKPVYVRSTKNGPSLGPWFRMYPSGEAKVATDLSPIPTGQLHEILKGRLTK